MDKLSALKGSFFGNSSLKSNNNLSKQETVLDQRIPTTFQFNSMAEFQTTGNLFFEYNATQLKESASLNYCYNLNALSHQFNYFSVPNETKDLFNYADKVIRTLGKESFLENKIKLKSLESFCDEIYNTQMAVLSENPDQKKDKIKIFLEKMFESAQDAEIRLKNDKKLNKMGFPFSRVLSELISALDIFDKKYKTTDQNKLDKKLLDLIFQLENSVSNYLETPEFLNKANMVKFEQKTEILLEFQKKAKELNEIWLFYKENLPSAFSAKSIKNSFINIYITNKFLLLKSMLETVGLFYFDLDSKNCQVLSPAYFIGNLKEFYLHFILSLTDLSVNAKKDILKIEDATIDFKVKTSIFENTDEFGNINLDAIDNSISFDPKNEEFEKAGLTSINTSFNEKFKESILENPRLVQTEDLANSEAFQKIKKDSAEQNTNLSKADSKKIRNEDQNKADIIEQVNTELREKIKAEETITKQFKDDISKDIKAEDIKENVTKQFKDDFNKHIKAEDIKENVTKQFKDDFNKHIKAEDIKETITKQFKDDFNKHIKAEDIKETITKQFKDEFNEHIKADDIKKNITENLKADILINLKDKDVKDTIIEELKAKFYHNIGADFNENIKENVTEQIKSEINKQIKTEEIKETITNRAEAEILKNIKADEIQESITEQFKAEFNENIKVEDMKEAIKNRAEAEIGEYLKSVDFLAIITEQVKSDIRENIKAENIKKDINEKEKSDINENSATNDKIKAEDLEASLSEQEKSDVPTLNSKKSATGDESIFKFFKRILKKLFTGYVSLE